MSALSDRLRRLAIGAGWDRPFFLPPLSQVMFLEDARVPIMGIHENGTLRFNPSAVEALSDPEKVGVLFHEIMHVVSRHGARRGDRDHMMWNFATDAAINQFLKSIGETLPSGAIYPPQGSENCSAEVIFERIKDDPKWQKMADRARAMIGGPPTGQGCGCQKKGPGEPDGRDGGEAVDWESVAAQSRALAAGTGHADSLARLVEPRASGIRWETFLRGVASRALAEHGKDEQTWSKRSRRSPPGLLFPGWKATRAKVAVALDLSGSVSDAMVSRGVDEVIALSKKSDARIFLVIHDDGIKWCGWLRGDRREVLVDKLRGRGGTTFDEAYQRVGAERASFDAFVHLTDGEIGGTWPNRPANCRRLVAAIYGIGRESRSWSEPPAGTHVVMVEV